MVVSYSKEEFDLFTDVLVRLVEEKGPMDRFTLTIEMGREARRLYEQEPDIYPRLRIGALKTYIDEMIESGMLAENDGKYTIS